MLKTKRSISLLALGAALLPALAHASVVSSQFSTANLLTNGSFELASASRSLNVNGWYVFQNLYGWNVDPAGGVEIRDNVAGTAQQGENFVELDTDKRSQYGAGFVTNTNSWISQTVHTKPGQTYTLNFWYAPRENTAANTNGIQLDLNGAVAHTYSGDSREVGNTWNVDYKVDGTQVAATSGRNDSGNVWRDFTYTFVATGTTSNIKFAAVGSADSYGGSLDNVSLRAVSAVPEPTTYALMAAGLGLIALRSRKSLATRNIRG